VNYVLHKYWPRQGHDANLSKPPYDSCRPKRKLARDFEKHQAAFGGSLKDLTYQKARKPDVLQHIAVDNEIGLAFCRISRCGHTGCCRYS